MPYDESPAGRAVALERGDGVAELVFAPRGPGSGLVHLYQSDPCRVLFPRAEAGDPPTAVLLTTSGGLAGGDRLRVSVAARAGAAATVTSQAAEKIYRSSGADCRIGVTLDAATGAWLEWLPQETILFEGARLSRRTEIAAAPGARLLACEMVVFGRIARGERFTGGFLRDGWAVRRAGALVWADALRLDGDIGMLTARPATLGGAQALASVVYVADDAARHLDTARDLLAGARMRAAATVVNGILVARFHGGDAAAVRRDLMHYLGGLRQAAGGLPAHLPRMWRQ
ncbi:MAG: urease accessory protein UreD [Rhodospirillales bacterium]|nr:urease accessory protein UreD [Rhodospirillales bacterium]